MAVLSEDEAFDEAFAAYATETDLAARGVDVGALKAFVLTIAMPRTAIKSRIMGLLEPLADIEHQRWSDWQRYQHGKCYPAASDPGALMIPSGLVALWNRKISTPYVALSDEEKQSDREQVNRYLPLIVDALCVPGALTAALKSTESREEDA